MDAGVDRKGKELNHTAMRQSHNTWNPANVVQMRLCGAALQTPVVFTVIFR